MTGMIAESIAGERGRRTLETLRASRLADRAILFGQLGAAVGYGAGLTLICFALGRAAVNLLYGSEKWLFYPAVVVAAILEVGLLGGAFVDCLGTLLSLRASTVRQACLRLNAALLLVFVPFFGLQYLLPRWQAARTPSGQNWPLQSTAVGACVMLVDRVPLTVTVQRFRRPALVG